MTALGVLQIVLYVAVILAIRPLALHGQVFQCERTLLTPSSAR
jgi:hypothetical protein